MIFTCLGLLRMVEEEVPIVKHFSGKKCQLPATFLAQKGRKVIKRVVPTRINSVILWGNHKNGYSMLWHLQPLFSLALLHKSLQATCWIVVLQAKSSLLLMLSALLSLLHAGSLWQYILFTSGYDLSIYGRLHCCILESMTAAGCFSCFQESGEFLSETWRKDKEEATYGYRIRQQANAKCHLYSLEAGAINHFGSPLSDPKESI